MEELDTNQSLLLQLNSEFTAAVLPVTIFIGFEAVLGFLGNCLVLYVFLFKYHKCNFRYFVLNLAIIDITSCVTTMPGEIVSQHFWYAYPVPKVCKTKSFFNIFTVSSEAMCLLIIAVDRYLKVCRPLGWQMKPRIAIYLCIVFNFVSFFLAIPITILWGTHSINKIYQNVKVKAIVCEKDAKYVTTNMPFEYATTCEVLISACIVIMFVIYIFVTHKILKDKRALKSAPVSQSTFVITTPESDELDSAYNSYSKSQSRKREEIKHLENETSGSNTYNYATSTTSKCTSVDETSQSRKREEIKHLENETSGSDTYNYAMSTTSKCTSVDESRTKKIKEHWQTKTVLKKDVRSKVRRKTWVMFILTVAFMITTVLYLTLLSLIAEKNNVLETLSNPGKAVYFFFFRLYFINHVINPVVYGILDPRFKSVLRDLREIFFCCRSQKHV